MEFLLGLMTWPLLVSFLFFLCVITEYKGETGWTMFLSLAAIGASIFIFSIPAEYVLYGVLAYIPIGTCWSIWRYRRYCRNAVRKFAEAPEHHRRYITQQGFIDTLHPSRNKTEISVWLIAWPASMLACSLKDVIYGIEVFTTRVIGGVYRKIFEGAVKDIEKIEFMDK